MTMTKQSDAKNSLQWINRGIKIQSNILTIFLIADNVSRAIFIHDKRTLAELLNYNVGVTIADLW